MYGNGQAPIFILKDGTQRTRGRTAQSNNIAAAKAVADAVRSTLGPKGMDKMLVDSMGDVVITNDGATILKEMDIEHPAAKMIIEVAKTQEQHCFDGTTSAVILSGELLKRSEDLIEQNVHPTVICEGSVLPLSAPLACSKVMEFQPRTPTRFCRKSPKQRLQESRLEPSSRSWPTFASVP